MNSRILNVWSVILGIVFLFASVPSLLHNYYEYFDSVEEGWVSYVAILLIGVWCLVYGLIGLVRSKRETTE